MHAMHIKDSRVVVLGATGNVGWGAARALLRRGARIFVVTRRREQPDWLAVPEQVEVVLGDLGTPEGAGSAKASPSSDAGSAPQNSG